MYQYRYQNIFCVELAQFKKDVSKLEREISIKIQENQMNQHEVANEKSMEIKETPVVKIEKSLLPKKEIAKKSKGMKV